MTRSLVLCAALGPLLGSVCLANPVADDVADQFRSLVRTTAITRECSDPALLAEYFGRFGLDLLSQEEIEGIERQFSVFAPILAESQRPCRRLSYEVQALYRRHANREERDAMLRSLREWLTAWIDSAPWHGVVWPLTAVASRIQMARVEAAEMLSAWGDKEAGPLMVSLAAPDTLSDELQWHLERALACLDDPAARTFIAVRPDGTAGILKSRHEMDVATLQVHSRRRPRSYSLSEQEVDEVWEMIAESAIAQNSGWIGSNYFLSLEFADGVRAELSPTEPGRVTYKDNSSLDYRRLVTLQNERLWTWISHLCRRELQGNE